MLNKCIFILAFIAFFFSFHISAQAQVEDKVCKTDYQLKTENTKVLSAELDNISFFKDNEFAGQVLRGYSLPGMWLQPKLVYQPLDNIKLELGMHALIYEGAYKFPTMAYRDIAVWKGNQYQKGAHLLPYFRAQIALKNVNLVAGNLYGGSTHNLILPLYNPELNLTADPEMGLQFLLDLPKYHLDLWVNWQSYIFELDTHQEAFTVGLSSQIRYNAEDAPVHFYSPVQALIQHRGGEQDTISTNSVQTLMNGAVGAGINWNLDGRVVQRVNLEVDALAYYQQAGELWNYDSGFGLYAAAYADMKDIRVKAGYMMNKDFISMFGSPFFGAASLRNPGYVFDKPQTVFASVEYSRTFGKHYSLGAKADVFQYFPGDMVAPDGSRTSLNSTTSFSFGVYFRINPSFLLKRWK